MLLIFLISSILISAAIYFIRNRFVLMFMSALFMISISAIGVYSYFNIDKGDSVYFKFDSISVILTFIMVILSIATFYHSRLYISRNDFSKKSISIYYATFILLTVSMTMAYFAENLVVMWVSIEASTLLVSILTFHERTKEALEATWKYLFISSLGIAFTFIGILFLSITASSQGITDLSISNLISISSSMNPLWLKVAFLLALTGFSAKMNLFPLHTVAVDAKTFAPTPISAFLSTALINIGFIGIFRFFTIISSTEILHWAQNVLLIAGIASILMAALQMFRVRNYKRLFAFSSLEHMGFIAIALGVGGLGYYAAILHLIFHSFVKASLFYQIEQAHQFFKSYWIENIGGYFKLNPVGGLAMILASISILAIPPSGLFISEFLAFKAMFLGGYQYIAIFVLLLLTVIIYKFSKFIFHLLYSEVPRDLKIENVKINPFESISQFLLLGLVIYLGIDPPIFFTNLINSAIAVLN